MAAFVSRQATKLTNAYTRVANYGQKKWPIFKKYAVVELTPPSPAEIPQAFSQAKAIISKAQSGAWKNVTVFQFTCNSVVALEVICWFFAGECIGKRSWVGYPVRGAVFTPISFQYDDYIH